MLFIPQQTKINFLLIIEVMLNAKYFKTAA